MIRPYFLDTASMGFTFNFYGQNYGSLYLATNGQITFNNPNGDYINSDLSSYPSDPTIAPYWDDLETFDGGGAVYYQKQGSQLVLEWSNVEYYFTSGPITFEAVLDSSNNTIQFNYANLAGGAFNDNGASATVGIKDANYSVGGADPLVASYNSGPNAYVNSFQSTLIGTNLVPPPVDYYAVNLTAGVSSTLVLQSLDGKAANFTLFDPGGNPIATSSAGAKNYTNGLVDFVPSVSGTYYVEVQGTAGDTVRPGRDRERGLRRRQLDPGLAAAA